MQRRYVWRSTRVRDLMDSLYRGYPSGAILLWETGEDVPLQEFSVPQQANPYRNTQLLLDGQQRLTSLSAVIRGEPVTVRGRKKPIELLFNLKHPDQLAVVTEVNEDDDGAEEDPDSSSQMDGVGNRCVPPNCCPESVSVLSSLILIRRRPWVVAKPFGVTRRRNPLANMVVTTA